MKNAYKKLLKKNEEGYSMIVNNEATKNYPYGGELALLRKEIYHIEQALKVKSTKEFSEYYEMVENLKANFKEALNTV